MRIDKNTTIRLGNRNIVKIKKGDVVIWQKTTEPVEGPDYFYIESLGDANTISVKNKGNGNTDNVTPTLEYSTDKNTWNTITFDWTSGTHTTELPVKLNTGEKMYFRNDTRKFSNSSSKCITFSSTVSSNVGGDIRTLSNYLDVNSETTPQSNMFYGLFNGNKNIVDASNLRLSYTSLADYCYYQLFYGCTSLVTAPELSATTLASSCCRSMFEGCTSLTTAPALPPTTLADYCYANMFQGCTSLTSTPILPATTLVSDCYSYMFYGCTSLTIAPELPATTMKYGCYEGMFQGCSKLKSVTVYAKDISATDCTKNWLSNVANSGTFNNMGFAPFKTGSSGVPSGWTEVVPPIQSITANPDTFTIKSYKDTVKCTSTLTITTTTGITTTHTNSATITVGENTGDTTRTLTETIPYKSSSYQVTIIQTANDVKTFSWNVVSTGTYPFELNSNGYYESTNKGQGNSYSYATLNYSGFDELVLECINSGELNFDYGIISQPDVQLSESTSDDGGTGSTNVFHNFKSQSSTNPVQITIPSDKGSHFITIKFRKECSSAEGND